MKRRTLNSIRVEESNDQFSVKDIKASHHFAKNEKLSTQVILGKNFKSILLNKSPQTKINCKINIEYYFLKFYPLVCEVNKIKKYKNLPFHSGYKNVAP